MNRNRLLMVILITLSLPGFVQAAKPDKPNVIIILADDMGWADVGYHGSKIETPSLDCLRRLKLTRRSYFVILDFT